MRTVQSALVALALLVAQTIQDCSLGCLKCSPAGTCLVCDTTNMYIVSGNSCALGNLTNCQTATQSGACAFCKASYYVDQATQKCLPVAVSKVVSNCAAYSSQQACVGCANNFYLANGKCAAVNSTIPNCLAYTAQQTCFQCATGYIPSFDLTQCATVQPNSNCLSFTYVTCGGCSAGYFNDPNSYFTSISAPSGLAALVARASVASLSPFQPLISCRATTVANCLNFTSFNTCANCLPGFYLAAGLCVQYPLPVISGCLVYNGLKSCVQCQSGMYLANATSCVMNSPIANCAVFNGSATATTCIQCSNAHFLQNNVCVQRTVSTNITNCAVLQISVDLCSACASGFNLTSDSRACLATIPNCQVYVNSTYQTSALVCSVCSNGYYIVTSGSTNSCVQGTLSNCLVYSPSANTCVVCANGYYVQNNLCVQHITISNCAVYDPVRPNYCNLCTAGFYSFAYSTVCISVTPKSNCANYTSDGNTCTGCAPNYYLINGACLQIPSPVANCATYTSTTCTACSNGYMLNTLISSSPNCTLPFDYVTAYCSRLSPFAGSAFTWAVSMANPIVCTHCATNGIAITPLGTEAICVLMAQASLYSAGFTFASVPSCYRFGLNTANPPVLVCMQCIAGNYLTNYWTLKTLSTSTFCQNSCVTSATSPLNTLILDDFFGFNNICVPTGSSAGQINDVTCQVWARVTTAAGTIADYKCVSAAVGSLMVYQVYQSDITARDIPGPTTPTTIGTFYTAGHGFYIGELNVRPSVFNHWSYHNLTVQVGASNSSFTNCELLFMPSATGTCQLSMLSCMRCTFGQYQLMAGLTNNCYPKCVAMTTCSGYRVGGLPSYLSAMASCHVCNSNGGVAIFPTVYFEYAQATASPGFNMLYQFSNRNTGTTAVFECAAAPTSILTLNTQTMSGTGATAPVQPLNCGFFGVLSSVASSAITPAGNTNNYCLACATNTFPTYATAGGTNYMPAYAVASCTAAPNCDTTVTVGPFNSCTRCIASLTSGTSVAYYAFTDTLLTNCQLSISKNCLILSSAMTISTVTANPCWVCLSGYLLNADGYCESYAIPNAVPTSKFSRSFYAAYWATTTAPSNTVFGFDKLAVRVHYLLSFTASVYGLSNGNSAPCLPGYQLSAASNLAPALCVLSPYIQNQTIPASGSKYVPNCIAYASPSVLLITPISVLPCVACVANFIPTADKSACVNSIANCQVAQSGANSMLCAICQTNFYNANGVCYNSTIANCLVYANNPSSATQTSMLCLQCAVGFSLSSSQLVCSQGLVSNCAAYLPDSTAACTNCVPGYTLISLSSGQFYCYPFSTALNATALVSGTVSTAGSNNGSIVAASCIQTASNVYGLAAWSSLSTAGVAQTVCMSFVPVVNCANYSQNSLVIGENTFQCLVCNSGFYLTSSGSCLPRAVNPSGCIVFSNTSDVCLACQSGSFVNSNGTACQSFPAGIFGCSVYSGPNTCAQCLSPYFLSNGTCALSTVVPNCAVYSANYTCSACNSNYYLSSSTVCTAATATNCLTFASATACATCSLGFGLQTVGSATNCVNNTLPNCINSTTVYPFTCLQCGPNYYPNTAGVCTLVPTAIANCLIYATASTCLACTQNAVLSVDGLACNTTYFSSLVDPNCVQSTQTSTAQCSICAFGYYFSGGACTACSGNGLSSGCLSCNPYNNTICIACLPGYYQVANGTCYKASGNLNQTTSNNATNTSANKTTNTTTSAAISSSLVAVLIGVTLSAF